MARRRARARRRRASQRLAGDPYPLARLIARSALERRESRGCHLRDRPPGASTPALDLAVHTAWRLGSRGRARRDRSTSGCRCLNPGLTNRTQLLHKRLGRLPACQGSGRTRRRGSLTTDPPRKLPMYHFSRAIYRDLAPYVLEERPSAQRESNRTHRAARVRVRDRAPDDRPALLRASLPHAVQRRAALLLHRRPAARVRDDRPPRPARRCGSWRRCPTTRSTPRACRGAARR